VVGGGGWGPGPARRLLGLVAMMGRRARACVAAASLAGVVVTHYNEPEESDSNQNIVV